MVHLSVNLVVMTLLVGACAWLWVRHMRPLVGVIAVMKAALAAQALVSFIHTANFAGMATSLFWLAVGAYAIWRMATYNSRRGKVAFR